ncbi:hypothetical protein GCM10022226_06420 [Sphaerisporangium flaviroseum]|uniref:Uncharacterized protein n=1 Tax=Sphaerisporangium flaviroseum TaxID=509199 RepID=A0ABP7HF28_9ACTN
MKIRIIGLPDEVTQAAEIIGTAFDVIEISDPYPCRGASRNVRIYTEVRPPERPAITPSQAGSPPQPSA